MKNSTLISPREKANAKKRALALREATKAGGDAKALVAKANEAARKRNRRKRSR